MYHPHWASPLPNQSSPIPAFNLDDDDFEPLSTSISQPSQHTEGPSEHVEDDSPVEEVAAVKPKRKYTRRGQPIKKNDKEFVESWTPEEEVALCKAWVHASENSVEGNGKKVAGFWTKDVEVQEVRPMGRDAGKKKGSSSSARSESLVAGDPSLVDALVSKFTMAATSFFSSMMDCSSNLVPDTELVLYPLQDKLTSRGDLTIDAATRYDTRASIPTLSMSLHLWNA
nr:hypothetical protein [Tanacetum cinerariifolium]